MSKLVRVYAGSDGQSHIEHLEFQLTEHDGTRTIARAVSEVSFAHRRAGAFTDFHPAPRRQYVIYLSAGVEIAVGDGSSELMDPGDVLIAEDTTGRGHTSRVRAGMGGLCAFVPIAD